MISDKSAKISIKLFVTTILVLIAILGINAIMVNADIPDVWYCSKTTTETGTIYKVCTELDDYSPESTVFVKGNWFAPETSLQVRVTRPDGSIVNGDGSFTEWVPESNTVATDEFGEFHYDYILDGIFGTYKVDILEIDGATLATHYFTDANPGKITVTKLVINDNGGNATASSFTLTASGTCFNSPINFPGNASGTNVSCSNSGNQNYNYSITEATHTGYTVSYSTGCSGNITRDQIKTCTVTNDDIAPSCDATACNLNDSWYNTSNTQWVENTPQCTEKEQKEQEYRDYECVTDSCTYTQTNTQWVDTGNTRNKADGTTCDDGLFCTVGDACSSGICTGSARDCSGSNNVPIGVCDNNPDDNPRTWDFYAGFTSTCNEESDSCTTEAVSVTSTCDYTQCSAECDATFGCADSYCSATYEDYCTDTKLTEFDDDKVMDSTVVSDSAANTCDLASTCACSNNPVDCSAPTTSTYCVLGVCGATCDSNDDCLATPCDNNDGCYENIYRDYSDVNNNCLDACSCEQ
ncbi:MAG TPA: hypothetical protein VJ461_04105, partial [Candidatus Nanoarchaeia archaeon]|nr:hypothetical protein [Candidatus Nanoarchaeia archaeon]